MFFIDIIILFNLYEIVKTTNNLEQSKIGGSKSFSG
jgi:hypothetical protein